MLANIDDSNLSEFPQNLAHKLKQIRERSGLTPEEFAPHVNAKNGKAIQKYERGNADLPMSVLMGYGN